MSANPPGGAEELTSESSTAQTASVPPAPELPGTGASGVRTAVATALALLLIGGVLVLAVEVTGPEQTSRARLEGLVVQAAAALRAGRTTAAHDAFRLALEAARATAGQVALASLERSDSKALHALVAATPPSTTTLERPVFPREVAVVRLTNQELLMLRGLSTFGSQRELAEAMYLSLNTVKTHLRAAYQKLGASSRAEALTLAGAAGLL